METLSLTGHRWAMSNVDPGQVIQLANDCDIPPVVARCLAIRNIDPTEALAWLHPSLDHLHDPRAMRGMDVAIERVRKAVRDEERIRIVTDYDVDGTTSSLILQGTLKLLGAGDRVDYHIPDRQTEGYGFSRIAAEAAAKDGIGLIITADIGVRDHEAVSAATAEGVDVLICDHHLPAGAEVPVDAVAVLCPPQAGCAYPNPHLAACGVSLKLAQALLSDHPRYEAIIRSMLKIAAIGTVADVVDLSTLENRSIVRLGLDGLAAGPNTPGLQALLDIAQVGRPITAQDLGFRVGPRINAAGRLAKATAVLELIASHDPAEARQRAMAIDSLNTERRAIQRRLVDRCMSALPDPTPPFAVLWGPESEGWHRGVVGIVAAKVRDQIHRPTAIVAVAGEEARGSVRSLPGVHAVEALDAAKDLLISYGGHPAAAGFSASAAHLPALAERLAAHVEQMGESVGAAPVLHIDANCPVESLAGGGAEQLANQLAQLEPFGKGNEAPLLRIPNVVPTQIGTLGQDHVRMRVGGVDVVWWGGASHMDALRGPVALAGTLGFNHWRGRTTVRFTVRDAQCAGETSSEAPPPAR
jgi:single-stranded-DNA-specific exonuclease